MVQRIRRVRRRSVACAQVRAILLWEKIQAMNEVPPMTEPLESLLTTEMPFGKYKGTRIADLPGNYLNWFAQAGFPSGRLGRQLALMHEIDHNGLKHLLEPLRGRQGD